MAYIINLDEYSDIGTHWVALYVHNDDVIYFDSFGLEHIPKEVKAFINGFLSMTTNIFKIQVYDSVMCWYFCIGFIDFTNIFSPNNFKKNEMKWYNFKLFYE